MRALISCEQRGYVRSLTANRGQSEHWDPPGNSLVWRQMLAFVYGIIELGYMRTTAANELTRCYKRSAGLLTPRAPRQAAQGNFQGLS